VFNSGSSEPLVYVLFSKFEKGIYNCSELNWTWINSIF